MRISDWSSDVCSSDLNRNRDRRVLQRRRPLRGGNDDLVAIIIAVGGRSRIVGGRGVLGKGISGGGRGAQHRGAQQNVAQRHFLSPYRRAWPDGLRRGRSTGD